MFSEWGLICWVMQSENGLYVCQNVSPLFIFDEMCINKLSFRGRLKDFHWVCYRFNLPAILDWAGKGWTPATKVIHFFWIGLALPGCFLVLLYFKYRRGRNEKKIRREDDIFRIAFIQIRLTEVAEILVHRFKSSVWVMDKWTVQSPLQVFHHRRYPTFHTHLMYIRFHYSHFPKNATHRFPQLLLANDGII